MIVDPGLDLDAIQNALDELALRPNSVFCTHAHFDHVGSAAALQTRYGLGVHLHRSDIRTLQSANFTMMLLGRQDRITLPRVDVLADDGSEYLAEGDRVRFLHTPGHTPGSSTLLFRDMAFTGDTMFRTGIGFTGFPGEDRIRLRRSVKVLWEALPAETVVAPGHGGHSRFDELQQTNVGLRAFLAEAEERTES
jgi:glyoxylase-like metal-dependent hydrolase (beta-lactamase superfamily II)